MTLLMSGRLSTGLFSSDSVEWYTPPNLVELVAECLSGIDLDPCAEPAKAVPARKHYTEEDDGLARDWHGTVFMNPPYGNEIGGWVERLVGAYSVGDVSEAIALLPARTDTKWMSLMRTRPRCFVRGRIGFSGAAGAPFPSVFVYFGDSPHRFAHYFKEIGDTYGLLE